MNESFYTDRHGHRHPVWFMDGEPTSPVFIEEQSTEFCKCRCLIRGPKGSFIESAMTQVVGYDRLHPTPSLGELCLV